MDRQHFLDSRKIADQRVSTTMSSQFKTNGLVFDRQGNLPSNTKAAVRQFPSQALFAGKFPKPLNQDEDKPRSPCHAWSVTASPRASVPL
jgi:hypothetical protein